MDDRPLAVPVQLAALVVNDSVTARDDFRWWDFDYLALRDFRSPEPRALADSTEVDPASNTGIHLQWTLPDALRHAGSDPDAGRSQYPLVPNRWLVVRVHGDSRRSATAWVVESDCPMTDEVTTVSSEKTSMYLVDQDLVRAWQAGADAIRRAVDVGPDSEPVRVARIGVSFPLETWRERARQPMFLSAVAPSNPLFASYYAHNKGVFSFHDDLAGIDQATLSYFVFGWYSDPAGDVLAAAVPFAQRLAQLRWTVGDDTEKTAASVYHGAALSIGWARTGPAPHGDPLQEIRSSGALNVGIGNTTVDAFTALIEAQLADPAKAKLLRAFQYDFLQQLNQPNGDALLDEKIRQAWFDSEAGGYGWTIVADKSHGTTAVPLTDDEQRWLHQLNADQAALDSALARLRSLQWQLHNLWLKQGYLADPVNAVGVPDPDAVRDAVAAQLDPNDPGSVTAQLVAQFDVVRDLRTTVPVPSAAANAQTALQEGIERFARLKQLDPAKTLKARAAPRYWRANNPVVVVSGVQPPQAATSDADLRVRGIGQLVTGFSVPDGTVDTASVAPIVGQLPCLAVLPAAAEPLLREFLLLDPGNAAAIARFTGRQLSDVLEAMTTRAGHVGVLPAMDLTAWRQPWQPMFLEWSTTYVPLPSGASAPWTFDGTDYRLLPGAASEPDTSREVGGISLLSPHTSTVFRARLDAFVEQFGSDNDLAHLDEWVRAVYGWRVLAQELTGFNETLSLRDLRAFRRPAGSDTVGTYPAAALAGYPDGTVPPRFALPPADQYPVTTVPLLAGGEAEPFHGLRGGQLHFTDLRLYDAFGRVLYVIQSGRDTALFDDRNFPMRIDDALMPEQRLILDVASVVQLRPRLLQHARLDIRLVDGRDDAKVYEMDPGVTPIAGWVLPNHVDRSLLLYAPDGTTLGEFRLVAGTGGGHVGGWLPLPGGAATLDDVTAAAPHLRTMLDAPGLRDEAGFLAFLAAIDETLWTTDPLGNRVDQNLSVLAGRPIALVRARLRFELAGDPIGDTGWAATVKPAPPDFLQFPFRIRLGDLPTRQDGVIGYFTGTDYDVFHSTSTPATAERQAYVRVIGPVGDPAGDNYLRLTTRADDHVYVTVLADPRAAIHATTGVLPVKRLDIPQQFVDGALSHMEISFRTGPALTVVVPSPDREQHPSPFARSVVHPLPAEQNGTWAWYERTSGAEPWAGYGLVQATPDARATTEPNCLREGVLQFTTDLGERPSQ
jgi:hypothetical protein